MLIKTKREISWNIYITAFIISAVIFGVGIFIGLQIEKSVTESMTETILTTRQSITSLETMLIFEESPQFCDFFVEEMNRFDVETANLGQKIGYMEEHKGNDPILKSEYMILELRDYLLLKKIDRVCNTKTKVVLYFLDSITCTNCISQGWELTNARKEINMRVYSFDMAVNNTAITALKKSFNITNYPSLVIDGNKYSEFITAAEIQEIILADGK